MTSLARFLNPKSIAYVGGSQISGPVRASRRAGYQGDIWIVNPVRDEVEGIKCHTKASDLPMPPDAAVIGLSPERAITAVAELSTAGCGGAVVMSSGFAELNTDEGRDRQRRLVEAAGEMPLLGPNCMGMINQFSGAAVWGDDNHIERQEGPSAALISQSGALMIGITNVEQAFPLGYVASIGNQAVTSMAELIEAVLEDDRIRAIGLYVEGMNEGEPFGRACLKAAKKGIPVIALKGGDDAAGVKVAMSHTASMVVDRDLWEAFCIRFGIVEVSSPKSLVETLKLLTVSGMPKGNRVSIVSYSGGLNGLAATRCGPLGISLHDPTKANRDFLVDMLPETVAVQNPLDLNIPFSASDGSISMQDTSGVADAIIAFAESVADQIIFFIDVPRPGAAGLDKVWCDSLEALITVRERLGIPVSVAGIMPEGLPLDFRRHMHANGVACLLGYSEAMEALAVSIKLASAHHSIEDHPAPQSLLKGGDLDNTRMLDEANSKHALAEFGLQHPNYEVATPDTVGEVADKQGYPIALKVLSSSIPHKAKVGGVYLNLKDRSEVEAAAVQLCTRVENSEEGHEVTHILVERMVEDANSEVILGIKRHPAMGLALMIGRGGSEAEEMARFETMLLPLGEDDLNKALSTLGLKQHPAADNLRNTCNAVAEFATANQHSLITLDVNPVMLTQDGDAIAADALIVLGDEGAV